MARYLIETDKPVEFHAILTNHGIVPRTIIRLDLLTRKHRTTMMVQEAVLSWVDEEGNTGEEVVCTKYNPNVVDALNGAMGASGKASFDCSAPDCLDCERNDECNYIGLFEEASE